MQITVTNQKTKWMRPACRESAAGNQWKPRATATAIPAITSPIATTLRIAPARTAREPTEPRRALPRTGASAAPVTMHVDEPLLVGPPRYATKGGLDGLRSEHLPGRSGRDPRVRREQAAQRRRHPDDRLDSLDRRHRRTRALDDLLVDVGRPWILHPPPHVRRRRPRRPAARLLDLTLPAMSGV